MDFKDKIKGSTMLVILSMLYGNMSMSEREEISHETLGKEHPSGGSLCTGRTACGRQDRKIKYK